MSALVVAPFRSEMAKVIDEYVEFIVPTGLSHLGTMVKKILPRPR